MIFFISSIWESQQDVSVLSSQSWLLQRMYEKSIQNYITLPVRTKQNLASLHLWQGKEHNYGIFAMFLLLKEIVSSRSSTFSLGVQLLQGIICTNIVRSLSNNNFCDQNVNVSLNTGECKWGQQLHAVKRVCFCLGSISGSTDTPAAW